MAAFRPLVRSRLKLQAETLALRTNSPSCSGSRRSVRGYAQPIASSEPRRAGRPPLAVDIRALIQHMHVPKPSAVSNVALLPRQSRPQLASIDFFTIPTATVRVLFVFAVLSHDRRRIVHVNVTAHPTAAWTAHQLREAWPWDAAPRFVMRDRDGIYGSDLPHGAQAMGIEEVLTAPRSPWQNPFAERVIGSMRLECLDQVIVWNERSLRRHLQRYLEYYHEWRTHPSLDKDPPVPRAVQPPTSGPVVAIPRLGGLHHHYERRAA